MVRCRKRVLRAVLVVLVVAAGIVLATPALAWGLDCTEISDCLGNTARGSLSALIGVGMLALLLFAPEIGVPLFIARGLVEGLSGTDIVSGEHLDWKMRALGLLPVAGEVAGELKAAAEVERVAVELAKAQRTAAELAEVERAAADAAQLERAAADAERAARVQWVDEAGDLRAGRTGMPADAYDYQSGATGARSNALTGRSRAPSLNFVDANGQPAVAKFDGIDEAQLIDRKLSVTTFPKSEAQVIRQSTALSQNGLTAVWEVPTAAQATRAQALFDKLGVTNITVRIVPR